MSYQEPNQPFGAPPQQPGQGQSAGWGQQSQQQGQQSAGWGSQGSWGQSGGVSQGSGQQQQGWGSQQGQVPQQSGYGSAPGYAQPGQPEPQDFAPPQYGQPQYGQQPFNQQQFNQQQPGYGQGYPGGQPGYMPQTDFGSGVGYGPGYPMPNQGNSGLATASLWLGIFGGWGLINLIISIFAIKETGPGKKLGRNKAVTGLILTIAWTAVWAGIVVAVSNHANDRFQPTAAPTAPVVASAGSGATSSTTGAAGEQAAGASSDPGCQAAQSSFNTYNANAESGGVGAMQTLGNALESAADESQAAPSQLKTMGQDFVQLSNSTTPPNMVNDLIALDTACGIHFTFSG